MIINILKLAFIQTNLDLKLVIEKTNFKLVLFYLKFFSFYFISSPYFFSLPINHFFLFFSIDFVNHPSQMSTNVRRRLTPLTIANSRRPLPIATTGYHRLSPATTTRPCQPLFALFATICHHCPTHVQRHHLPLSTIVIRLLKHKVRFSILTMTSPYPIKTQAKIVLVWYILLDEKISQICFLMPLSRRKRYRRRRTTTIYVKTNI